MTQLRELSIVSTIAELIKPKTKKDLVVQEKYVVQFLTAYLQVVGENSPEILHHCWLIMSNFFKEAAHPSHSKYYLKDAVKFLDFLFRVDSEQRKQWKNSDVFFSIAR